MQLRRRPRRGVARFLTRIGIALGVMWTARILAATIDGSTPDPITKAGQPTGVVFVMDLALVLPMMLLAAAWLRRRRPWGDVAAGVLLTKTMTIGLALLSMGVFNHAAGYALDPLMAVWAVLVVGSGGLTLRWLGGPAVPRSVRRVAQP